jgi:hypothetical protein
MTLQLRLQNYSGIFFIAWAKAPFEAVGSRHKHQQIGSKLRFILVRTEGHIQMDIQKGIAEYCYLSFYDYLFCLCRSAD